MKKINEVFKDEQARGGILALIDSIELYNKQLRDGGDIAAYGAKTDVMINGAEARWMMFYANITNAQTNFGKYMSESLGNIFGQQTGVATVQAFFMEFAVAVSAGILAATRLIVEGVQAAGIALAEWTGLLTPASAAKQKAETSAYFDNLYKGLMENQASALKTLKEEQIARFQAIANDTGASESLRAAARKSLEELAKGTQDGVKKATEIINQSGGELKKSLEDLSKNTALSPEFRKLIPEEIKKLGDSTAKEVKTTAAKIAASTKDLQAILTNLLKDTRLSSGFREGIKNELAGLQKNISAAAPAIKTAGINFGTSLTDGVLQSLEQGRPVIQTRAGTLGTNIPTAPVAQSGHSLGTALWQGFVNGMADGNSSVVGTAYGIARNAYNAIRDAIKSESPSKETYKLGGYFSDGFALGIEKNGSKAIAAAKKVANETLKALNDAQKEFEKLAGASPETQDTIRRTSAFSDAAGNQQELIKLRGQLGVNSDIALPDSVGGTNAELARLQNLVKINEKTAESYDALGESVKEATELQRKYRETVDERLTDVASSANLESINLSREIDLIGVIDEAERQRIINASELLELRETLKNDGYAEADIESIATLTEKEQERLGYLRQILEVKKQTAAASDLGKSLQSELAREQTGNRDLTEYEKTLIKINEDLKDIDATEKERLLNIAAQIDGQRQLNEQYAQTYEFVRDSLDVLTDSGKTFGEKMKTIFGGVFNSFKKMLLDMAAQNITRAIFGGGASGGASGGQGGGNFLTNLLG
ncbi:MAG TPA: hypothetical protein VGD05_09020, partial [Pyrinomonadaceae bacterium]